jgi:hypothetical protein
MVFRCAGPGTAGYPSTMDDRLGLAALGVVIGVAVTVWLTRAGGEK